MLAEIEKNPNLASNPDKRAEVKRLISELYRRFLDSFSGVVAATPFAGCASKFVRHSKADVCLLEEATKLTDLDFLMVVRKHSPDFQEDLHPWPLGKRCSNDPHFSSMSSSCYASYSPLSRPPSRPSRPTSPSSHPPSPLSRSTPSSHHPQAMELPGSTTTGQS
ncbi:uncharacterized protein B0T15DRAFT_204687 [Chaetomium strumarium]|uniref:Uncharacterized protein n=1 Tax=Chaetomium strumarium TaxID=1170767 RepID=A0AAJ0GTH5_9PEZI|nr:hypothetical protein B0T15DRAFT_204687 [Chaetomium strumarium]